MTSFFPPEAMTFPWESFRMPQLCLPNREMIDLHLNLPYRVHMKTLFPDLSPKLIVSLAE